MSLHLRQRLLQSPDFAEEEKGGATAKTANGKGDEEG